jgi:hypothetical protein
MGEPVSVRKVPSNSNRFWPPESLATKPDVNYIGTSVEAADAASAFTGGAPA